MVAGPLHLVLAQREAQAVLAVVVARVQVLPQVGRETRLLQPHHKAMMVLRHTPVAMPVRGVVRAARLLLVHRQVAQGHHITERHMRLEVASQVGVQLQILVMVAAARLRVEVKPLMAATAAPA